MRKTLQNNADAIDKEAGTPYLLFCFRSDRRYPFPKASVSQLIIDYCKYVLSDTHFVNSI